MDDNPGNLQPWYAQLKVLTQSLKVILEKGLKHELQ